MAMKWGQRRQLLYYLVGIIVLGVVYYVAWQTFFVHAPTCFDGIKNGNEEQIDCGGSCALICPDVARAPIILWKRAFQTAPGVYTAAAYIENDNTGAGAKSLPYAFTLYDADNQLVVEKDGVLDIPPVTSVPVVVPNIQVGNRTVARAYFEFVKGTIPQWNKVPASSVVPLHITDKNLTADGTRLTATIENDTVNDAKNVTVDAILYDASGTALAASKSIIAQVSRKSTQTVVFTWPQGVAGVASAELTLLPSF